MRKKLLLTTAIIVSSFNVSLVSNAAEGDLISFGFGYFDVFDDEGAADLRVEYRPNSPVFLDNLKPWAGAEITTDATVWMGGGLLYDWNFNENWYFTPSVGAGLYAQGSSDLDLGHSIEFRTQLEVSYEFDGGSRLGAQLSHISNAHLDSKNPGTEVFGIYWHVPLDKIL